MKRVFKLVEKYFFIIILIAVFIAVTIPNSFNWVMEEFMGVNIINVLLGIILFGMGTTLKIDHFVNVFKRPKEILIGVSAQYLLMPIIAFAIASLFHLNEALTVGLVLVGTVPGGTASGNYLLSKRGFGPFSIHYCSIHCNFTYLNSNYHIDSNWKYNSIQSC